MYICITNTGNLKAGDIIILQKNSDFGEVAASVLGGGIVGFITDIQPEGCLKKSFVESRIGNRRVIGRAVIINGYIALFSTESPILSISPRGRASVRRA